MSLDRQNRLLLIASVALMALGVFLVGRTQREAASSSFRQAVAVQGMLTGMLDQETGLRGFFLYRDDAFLVPYRRGRENFRARLATAHNETEAGDGAVLRLLARADRQASAWRREADLGLRAVRADPGARPTRADGRSRKYLMDDFRATEKELERLLAVRRERALSAATTFSVIVLVLLGAIVYLTGWFFIGRRASQARARLAAETARRESQTAFARTLQMVDSVHDAHALVKRHIERCIPGSAVAVLERGSDTGRLHATTPLPAGSPLLDALSGDGLRSCLAARLGALREQGDDEALLDCELCRRTESARTTCLPLLVSGQVIGSVLVGHEGLLAPHELDQLGDTVTQAAPVVANMRNLAVAEQRAATDPLTGLANRRALQDTLKRMLAQARRGGTSLTAIAMDLDHFKSVNDRFGHDKGDDVLVAAAKALVASVRDSDFVARHGGEEFLVLLPETGLDGGLVVAEHLRSAIAALHVPGVDRKLTASFGVAVFPEDADTPEALLRLADRALYLAKDRGRDRVEAVASNPSIPAL